MKAFAFTLALLALLAALAAGGSLRAQPAATPAPPPQAQAAAPSMGLSTLPAREGSLEVTMAYPSAAPEQAFEQGPFKLSAARGAPPAQTALPGSGRLVVLSHGTGGSPWTQMDLARALVNQGFVVAMASHRFDNWQDMRNAGPDSWKTRPIEISRTIDAVAADPRFAPMLRLDKVGVYGMSAGGLTALTLGGARWSPAQFARHCDAHAAEDFPTCAGLNARLNGGVLDSLKVSVAKAVLRHRFASAEEDKRWWSHTDPRVAAVVAVVPMVVPIDLSSLAGPGPTAIGLVTSGQDRWLNPQYHRDALLAACARCERVADMPTVGHGSTLSPWPVAELDLGDYAKWLLADPPGFDRSTLPATFDTVARWLAAKLR
jgi:predicted dienelactone hydrolase